MDFIIKRLNIKEYLSVLIKKVIKNLITALH
jgi:hypothetical protein